MRKSSPKRFWLILTVCVVLFSMSCNLVNHFKGSDKSLPGSASPIPYKIVSGVKDTQGITGKDGTIQFSGTASFSVKVVDQTTQAPLPNIRVNYLLKEQKILVIASDPAKAYISFVTELPLQQVDAALNEISLFSPSDYLKNYANWQNSVGQVQDIEDFAIKTETKCINPEQTRQSIKTLIGDNALLITGTNSNADAMAQGIRMTAGELGQEVTVAELDNAISAQTPAILKWKIYQVSESLPLIISPDGYCLDPLNSASAESVMQWIQYGVAFKDTYPFEKISLEKMQYVNYLEGGEEITQEQFLQDLAERIPNGAECAGILPYDEGTYIVFFKGWSPAWQMDKSCYFECSTYDPPFESSIAGFLIENYTVKNKYTLGKVWVNKPDLLLDAYSVSMNACTFKPGDGSPDSSSSAPTAVATSSGSCPNAPAQRMVVGKQGVVCTKSDSVALRTDPKKGASIIARISRGGIFDVIGGPKCSNDWSWWQIKLSDGTTGWISEGGDSEDKYYICPKD